MRRAQGEMVTMPASQFSSGTKVVPVRRKASRWVLVGTATTGLGVLIALMMAVFLDSQYFDYVSPPIAAAGFVCCAVGVATNCRPRALAFCMFGLNMAYWIFFCINITRRG
jgi:hypothetical protein